MNRPSRLFLTRIALLVTLVLCAQTLSQVFAPVYSEGILFLSRRWMAALAAWLIVAGATTALLILSFTCAWDRVEGLAGQALNRLGKLGWTNGLLFALLIAAAAFLINGRLGSFVDARVVRLLILWLLALAGAGLMQAVGLKRGWPELLAAGLVFSAAVLKAASFLPDISFYPFTLGWSETSRFYYASLYFSERIYGLSVPPTVLHPSRYLMQALPFLIPGAPLILHRAWQVGLWIGVSFLTAYLLARRLSLTDHFRRWVFIAWAFAFILLGPVYYHLQVVLILVIWGLGRFGKTPAARFAADLAVVLVASLWAGISRVNWFPVPAMLAASLYLMEQPVCGQKLWRYLLKPALWGALGLPAAIGSQAAYMLLSGNPPDQFTSSFTSDLIFRRLLPNPTFPLGVLPTTLLVSLPLYILIFLPPAWVWRSVHFIRKLGLAAMVLVLMTGGLLVSTKIGGGADLHNLDAYLSLLMVVAAYVFLGRVAPEAQAAPIAERVPAQARQGLLAAGITAALLIPSIFAAFSGGPYSLPSKQATWQSLAYLREYVDQAVKDGGRVLFLNDRQLITFGYLPGVKLEPDYERVFLMEMAMAGNPEYLAKFHDDLKNKRFSLIVVEPLYKQIKGPEEALAEENNAWVKQVSKQVLCYYKPTQKYLLLDVHLQVLVPNKEDGDCR